MSTERLAVLQTLRQDVKNENDPTQKRLDQLGKSVGAISHPWSLQQSSARLGHAAATFRSCLFATAVGGCGS